MESQFTNSHPLDEDVSQLLIERGWARGTVFDAPGTKCPYVGSVSEAAPRSRVNKWTRSSVERAPVC